MKAEIRRVAARFVNPSANDKIERFLKQEDCLGAVEYLYDLLDRVECEDADEDWTEEQHQKAGEHLQEFRKELERLDEQLKRGD